jgi:hypothetical protein
LEIFYQNPKTPKPLIASLALDEYISKHNEI